MLLAHADRCPDCVFRLKKSACPAFDAFIDSCAADATVSLAPPRDAPLAGSRRVRLADCVASAAEFRLAATLLDATKQPPGALADLYRRCREEEFYGVGKGPVGEFRQRTARGVKLELYAASAPVAVSRHFASRCEADVNRGSGADLPDMRASFRNGIRLLGREIEAMFLARAAFVTESVARTAVGLSRRLQRERRDRSHPSVSMKLRSKWMRHKAAS